MIGIDLIRTARMEAMIKRFGERGLRRFLGTEEIALIHHYRTAAGFWAAKEACAKALGCGIGAECGFHDIHISKTPKGAPLVHLSNRVSQHFGITRVALSITHDGEYTIAVVVVHP